jgi:hypothetical protein
MDQFKNSGNAAPCEGCEYGMPWLSDEAQKIIWLAKRMGHLIRDGLGGINVQNAFLLMDRLSIPEEEQMGLLSKTILYLNAVQEAKDGGQ